VNPVNTFPELEALKGRLEQQAQELHTQLDKVMGQLESVATTLELLKGQQPQQQTLPVWAPSPKPQDAAPHSAIRAISASDLSGLTQLEAIIKIAKANNNRVRLITARDLLLAAGTTTSEKNAMNIVFNVIKRSDRFIRVAAGIYELLPDGKKASDPEFLRPAVQ
jgi:hypothetical protein